jgi:hypothetical protein
VGEPVRVAIVGDGHPVDILHDEIGTALFGGAGIVDMRDVGVVHHGQSLALVGKTREDLTGIHSGFDYLERDLPMDGL